MRHAKPTLGGSDVKVAIGSDHRGCGARSAVKETLELLGHEVVDFGTTNRGSCDYPDIVFPAAQAVADGEVGRAILMGATGIGMAIAANKLKGIRAALCHDELTAKLSRQHQDANVLCLPVSLLGEGLIRCMVEVWLETPFAGGRHAQRLAKIAERESDLR